MQQVHLEEASAHLAELIEAAVRGEVVLITTDAQQVIRLVPVTATKPRRRFGSAKGLIRMAEDFDAPLEEFDPYMR